MSHAAVLDDKDLRLHDRPGFSDAGRRRSCDRQLLLKRSRRGAFVVTAPTRQERMPMSETLGLLRRDPISPAAHTRLDYLLVATLIAAPLALHYPEETAKVVMYLLGGTAGLLAADINLSVRALCLGRRANHAA